MPDRHGLDFFGLEGTRLVCLMINLQLNSTSIPVTNLTLNFQSFAVFDKIASNERFTYLSTQRSEQI